MFFKFQSLKFQHSRDALSSGNIIVHVIRENNLNQRTNFEYFVTITNYIIGNL